MPNKRVFVSAMLYDVQIEPTLADRPHSPFNVTFHVSRQGIIQYYLLFD